MACASEWMSNFSYTPLLLLALSMPACSEASPPTDAAHAEDVPRNDATGVDAPGLDATGLDAYVSDAPGLDAFIEDAPLADAPPSPTEPDGVWGIPDPARTLTLRVAAAGDNIYFPDVQAAYPAVDWSTLERLYIPAGHYRYIKIENLPTRTAEHPLIITNLGGQVHVGNPGYGYLFVIGGGSHWTLTGRFDPISRTGDAAFPGHRGGVYANTEGTYGIFVEDVSDPMGPSGVVVGGRATQFELSHIEVARVGFAGVQTKTDDVADATMRGVHLHDLYIHDTISEGFYLGNFRNGGQHQITDYEIDNNRVLRTGTDAMQMAQMGDGIRIHHNVFGPSAIDWRAAFQRYQDGNMPLTYRAGHTEIDHNIFLGGASNLVSLQTYTIAGDAHAAGDGVTMHDNLFMHSKDFGAYMANNAPSTLVTYTFTDNRFGGFDGWRYGEVYPARMAYPFWLYVAGAMSPSVRVTNNRFDLPASLRFISDVTDTDGNGMGRSGRTLGSGNTRGTVPPVVFRGVDIPPNFAVDHLELYAAVASLNADAPVSYRMDDIVMFEGTPYRCRLSPCPPGNVPDANPTVWAPMPHFSDDVRLPVGSPYAGLGLAR